MSILVLSLVLSFYMANCNGFSLPEIGACLIRQQPLWLSLWKKKAPEGKEREKERERGDINDHLGSGCVFEAHGHEKTTHNNLSDYTQNKSLETADEEALSIKVEVKEQKTTDNN